MYRCCHFQQEPIYPMHLPTNALIAIYQVSFHHAPSCVPSNQNHAMHLPFTYRPCTCTLQGYMYLLFIIYYEVVYVQSKDLIVLIVATIPLRTNWTFELLYRPRCLIRKSYLEDDYQAGISSVGTYTPTNFIECQVHASKTYCFRVLCFRVLMYTVLTSC